MDDDVRPCIPKEPLHSLSLDQVVVTAARDRDLGAPLRTEALHQMGPQEPGTACHDHTQTAPKAHPSYPAVMRLVVQSSPADSRIFFPSPTGLHPISSRSQSTMISTRSVNRTPMLHPSR